MSVKCLQIRPRPRPLVHFTGEDVTGWFSPARGAAVWDPGTGVPSAASLPAPSPRREETAGPAGEGPFLPYPELRRLQDCRGRSVFSLWTLPHWSGSPSKKSIIFPKEFGFMLV